MTKLPQHARHRKGRASPQPSSLFDHAERVRMRALPLPARRIARRYGLTAATALAVALAAGFRCGGDQ
jgi:hypothetical protein